VPSDWEDIQEKRLPFLVGPYVLEVEIYCGCSLGPGIFIMTATFGSEYRLPSNDDYRAQEVCLCLRWAPGSSYKSRHRNEC